MPNDIPQSFSDLSAIYHQRRKKRDQDIAVMNEVEAAIGGDMGTEYNRLFTEKDVKIQLRTLRLADDGLTKFLSDIPILPRVDPLGKRASTNQRNKAELVEKIAHGWHGTGFDGIRFQLARHQVRFADGCVTVNPDFRNRCLYLSVEDPRFHYPPDGWTPWSRNPLDCTLFVYELTFGEVKRRFGYDSYRKSKSDVLMRLYNAYQMGGEIDDSQPVKVGIYRSREAWFVCALGDKDVVLIESQDGDANHPGVCGVGSFQQFASEPIFLGQIGIEAGLMKVINQQIQNTERINKAPIVGPPLLGDTLRWGEYNTINMAQLQGRQMQPQRLAPDSPNNLTQVMGQFLSLAQMFNYNPESNQGQGDANSGKAIQQLQAGPRTLVTNILFAPYKVAWPRIMDDCLEMELNLWPNDKRTAASTDGRHAFEVDYIPRRDLQGFKGHIKIEDARPGGYNAYLEAQQKHDGGLIDLRSVLEQDPDIRDVEATIARMEAASNEKFAQTAFEGLAGADPLMAIKAAAEIDKRIGQGQSRFDALQEMVKEGFFEQPAAPEEPMPDLSSVLGNGQMGAPASLAAARGF